MINMRKKFEFSDSDKELVRQSVENLEKESSGEIVIYFARESDDYIQACWKLAGIFGLIYLAAIGGMSYLWLLPASFDAFTLCLTGMVAIGLGFAIPYFYHPLRIAFTPDATVQHRVITKARDIFLQEQVFDTIDRTGILIYISELEHIVDVLGDQGINQKINQEDWQGIVGLVIAGIKSNQVAQGIANAVDKCKELLLANGFTARHDNTNELSDDMRIEE